MRKISIIVLLFALVISCREDQKTKAPVVLSDKSIVYNGKEYIFTEENFAKLAKAESAVLEFDFENRVYLFDSQPSLAEFAAKKENGRFQLLISDLIKKSAEGDTDFKDSSPLKGGRIQSDYELGLIDTACNGYPFQVWWVNLDAYPSGTMNNVSVYTGYYPSSFSFTVPSGGSIGLLYSSMAWLDPGKGTCQRYYYVATTSTCRNSCGFTCDPYCWPTMSISWAIDV